MRINGLKYLDKNDYSSISIDSDNIVVTSKSKIATIKTGEPFSENLKGLDDDGKVNEIVDYFLRNNRLTLINDCYHSVMVGNEDRLLKFKSRFDKEAKDKILKKYIGDRKEVVGSVPVDTYIIENTTRMSAYSVIHGEAMRLVLAMKDDKYLEFERRFLEELLDIVFEEEAHIKTLYHKCIVDGEEREVLDGTYIIGEHPRGCRIRIHDNNNEIKMAVINHNTRIRKEKEESENAKKLQMKLEGF